jgi:hypothetical protein
VLSGTPEAVHRDPAFRMGHARRLGGSAPRLRSCRLRVSEAPIADQYGRDLSKPPFTADSLGSNQRQYRPLGEQTVSRLQVGVLASSGLGATPGSGSRCGAANRSGFLSSVDFVTHQGLETGRRG